MECEKTHEQEPILREYSNESQIRDIRSNCADSGYGTQSNKRDLKGCSRSQDDDVTSKDRLNKVTLNDNKAVIDIDDALHNQSNHKLCLTVTCLFFSVLTTSICVTMPFPFYTKEAEGRNVSVSVAGLVKISFCYIIS